MQQKYSEYLDALMENLTVDCSVTVQVNGQTIRFDDQNDFAEWAAEVAAKETA